MPPFNFLTMSLVLIGIILIIKFTKLTIQQVKKHGWTSLWRHLVFVLFAAGIIDVCYVANTMVHTSKASYLYYNLFHTIPLTWVYILKMVAATILVCVTAAIMAKHNFRKSEVMVEAETTETN